MPLFFNSRQTVHRLVPTLFLRDSFPYKTTYVFFSNYALSLLNLEAMENDYFQQKKNTAFIQMVMGQVILTQNNQKMFLVKNHTKNAYARLLH